MNDLNHNVDVKLDVDKPALSADLKASPDNKGSVIADPKKAGASVNDKSVSAKIEARQLIRQAQAVYKSKKKAGFKNKAEEVKAETLAQLVLSLDNVIKSLDKITK